MLYGSSRLLEDSTAERNSFDSPTRKQSLLIKVTSNLSTNFRAFSRAISTILKRHVNHFLLFTCLPRDYTSVQKVRHILDNASSEDTSSRHELVSSYGSYLLDWFDSFSTRKDTNEV